MKLRGEANEGLAGGGEGGGGVAEGEEVRGAYGGRPSFGPVIYSSQSRP